MYVRLKSFRLKQAFKAEARLCVEWEKNIYGEFIEFIGQYRKLCQ